jgi:hypothetical protein
LIEVAFVPWELSNKDNHPLLSLSDFELPSPRFLLFLSISLPFSGLLILFVCVGNRIADRISPFSSIQRIALRNAINNSTDIMKIGKNKSICVFVVSSILF